MRVIVTGGAGFIGRALSAELSEHGHDVVVTARSSGAGPAGVLLVRYRIGQDAPRAVLAEAGDADAVVHLAGPSNVWETEERGDEAAAEIVGGTREWLDALADLGRPVRFVFGGSCHEYGDAIDELGPQMREDMPARPASVYARAKLEAEQLALAANGGPLEVVCARAFNHVGIGQKPKFFLPSIVRRVVDAKREGRARIEAGDLSVVRDLNDVRDGARAYRLLVERGVPGRLYNVGSGRGLRLRDAVRAVLATLEAEDLLVEERPGVGARRDLGDHFADITRLTADTGYVPRYTFVDTIRSVRAELAARTEAGA